MQSSQVSSASSWVFDVLKHDIPLVLAFLEDIPTQINEQIWMIRDEILAVTSAQPTLVMSLQAIQLEINLITTKLHIIHLLQDRVVMFSKLT